MSKDSLGRFLPGNQIAKGNKGNTQPKWGNRNAVKHGFYSTPNTVTLDNDGNLCIFLRMKSVVRIPPSHFYEDEQGRYRVHNSLTEPLESMGVRLEGD